MVSVLESEVNIRLCKKNVGTVVLFVENRNMERSAAKTILDRERRKRGGK